MQAIDELYGAAAVREIDRRAIEVHGVAGIELMRRAATAAWSTLRARWPEARRLAVVAGSGNNGGDGYEVARLARAAGLLVDVHVLGGTSRGDAATARQAWLDDGGQIQSWTPAAAATLARADVIVDALFGTGLSRAPEGDAAAAIAAIVEARAAGRRVLALDLPSGLMADSGDAPGPVVEADVTVTFIAAKFGLFTGRGPALAGGVELAPLQVPQAAFAGLDPLARVLSDAHRARLLPPRPRDAHKGRNGHVLIVGGDVGMAGATLMAGRAALRAGAGWVSVATHPAHAGALVAAQPELMVHAVPDATALAPLLARADVVAVGPGLGQGVWGRGLWSAVKDRARLVVDADALNLLASAPCRSRDWVLTPHPGEAARLLDISNAHVQSDRRAAVLALQLRFGGIAVLKGAGSLVADEDGAVTLCRDGNPGMAVAGMGDALTGVIAALRGQGLSAADAARLGVAVHARAGDIAARHGERGLLPSDLIAALRAEVNP